MPCLCCALARRSVPSRVRLCRPQVLILSFDPPRLRADALRRVKVEGECSPIVWLKCYSWRPDSAWRRGNGSGGDGRWSSRFHYSRFACEPSSNGFVSPHFSQGSFSPSLLLSFPLLLPPTPPHRHPKHSSKAAPGAQATLWSAKICDAPDPGAYPVV